MTGKTLLIAISAFLIATLSPLFLKEIGYVQPEWYTVSTKSFQVILILGLVGLGILLLVWGCNFLGELAFRRNYSKFVSDVVKAKEVCIDIRNGRLAIDEAKRKYHIPAYMILCALNFKLEEEIISQQEKIKNLEEKLSEQ